MKILRLAVTAAALALSLVASAQAQTTLRIGLAEDPDILDPSLGRTYVGRIVFSAFCDKLFDIDEKLNIVPQLALSHETSADGKEMTIKLRPGVKFHDGEPFDAEAAKFSIERHIDMPGSFRKPELASVDHVEVVDPLTIKLVLKTPYLAADCATHRPRRHDGLAQGGEGGKATSSGCIRSAPVPTNSSNACSKTAWCSRSSPTTGTRTTSSSIASCFCRSSTPRCGSPTSSPAASI